MDTIKLAAKKNCRIIAHRGLSHIECENTLPAFVAAGNRSYYGIETDVHITSDGGFILLHDDSTGRVAGGVDLPAEGSSYEALRALMLADKDGRVGRTDLRLPGLEEYVTVCSRYEKIGVLELKNHMQPKAIEGIVSLIRGMSYLDHMIFISFDLDNMITLRGLLPDQKLQWLTGAYHEDIHEKLIRYRLDLDIQYTHLTDEIVSALHRDGIRVNCWTCDDPDTAQRLIEMGVDYITTNLLE